MEPNSVNVEGLVTAEISAAEFEPRNSREFYLACRDAFTADELVVLSRSEARLLGCETAHRELTEHVRSLPDIGSAPRSRPRTETEIKQSRLRDSIPYALVATIAVGAMSIREGMEARQELLDPPPFSPVLSNDTPNMAG